ncbi:unnamed protein product [Didymodactylos carnosus]|uniref:AMP-dependent synthetase/ligase domain-containing protein n=1 Tax=Didymodactylos carnosus TaxID=1234261 RepID=A0A8S2PJP5_9BILA|nr:unnamed protein product [Didymodactylos carnosus]CAF4052140.1 unnamed protein product [Didymodactylos carnosus]
MDILSNLPYKSIANILEHQSFKRPDKLSLLYPDPADSTQYLSLTYRQLNRITNYLSSKLSNHFVSLPTTTVVCILGNSDVRYLLMIYSLLKIKNIIVFPLSINNSKGAYEHLLNVTCATHLFTTEEYYDRIQDINYALKVIKFDLEFNISDFSTIGNDETILDHKDYVDDSHDELDRIKIILHSSGTTSYPKPIRLTNRGLLSMYHLMININDQYYTENDTTLTWGSLFHILALGTSINTWQAGGAYALPLTKLYPPTPSELLANIKVDKPSKITKLVCVPTLLEQLINEMRQQTNDGEIDFKPLKRLLFVSYAGAPCPDELCRLLVKNDIRLISTYGSTGKLSFSEHIMFTSNFMLFQLN